MTAGGDFNTLALELYRWQLRHNKEYSQLSVLSPEVTHWSEIPAVPVELLRYHRFSSFEAPSQVIFRTSGTTTGLRGEHHMLNTELYDQGALLQLHAQIGPLPQRGLSLVSPSPDSSLGHMCRLFVPNLVEGFSLKNGVEHPLCIQTLQRAKEPLFIPGTAFAFAELFRKIQSPITLPEGSILMLTGGFKGHAVQLSDQELYEAIHHLLPGCRAVGEYGMSELSSQLWSHELGGHFYPPPWLKVLLTDPETGLRAKDVGLLRFIDLANHQSIMAIETNDLGRIHDDGGVELLGRAPRSRARGCSITVEELHGMAATPLSQGQATNTKPQWLDIDLIAAEERATKILSFIGQLDPQVVAQRLQLPLPHVIFGLEYLNKNLSVEGAVSLLSSAPVAPFSTGMVMADGVFTAGVEWITLILSAGSRLILKTEPSSVGFYSFLLDHLRELGLPCYHTAQREEFQAVQLESILAFGTDATIEQIAAEHPESHLCGFGSRFSVAATDGTQLDRLAEDLLAYQGKGCMSPSWILSTDPDIGPKLLEALHLKNQLLPQAPLQNPQERRVLRALALLNGQLHTSGQHELYELPSSIIPSVHLLSAPLLYLFKNREELEAWLTPYRDQLSTLGWGFEAQPDPHLAPRIVGLGEMQHPRFPRYHDGVHMWDSLLPPHLREQ